MDAIEHYDAVDVFIGVDVGKGEHYAVPVALSRTGNRLFDMAMPNDETRLRALTSNLKQHDKSLLVVDQPKTTGALPGPSPEPKVSWWHISTALPCAELRICTLEKPRPMHGIPPSPHRSGTLNAAYT